MERLSFFVVVLGAGVGVSACARQNPQPVARGEERPAASVAAAVTPPGVLDPSTRGFELGKFYGYRLKLTTSIALANGPKAYDFDLTGSVGLIPVKVSPETVTLHVSIPDAAVQSRIPQGQADLDKVSAEMRETGAYFTFTKGQLGELFVPPGQNAMVSTVYRQVAAALQFARSRNEQRAFTTEEYDTTGRYVAEYKIGDGANVWQKRKLNYVELLGATHANIDRPIPVVPEVTSLAEVRLLPSGRPENVTLAESVALKGAQMPLNSILTVELTALGETTAPAKQADFVALLDRTRKIAASEPIGVAPSPDALDAARIGELDFEGILARLEKIAGNKAELAAKADDEPKDEVAPPQSDEERAQEEQQLKEDSRLFLALSALIRQKPETVAKVTRAIREKSPASFGLADALGNSSSSEAQKALVALIDEPGIDAKLRGRVINSLARTPNPTDGSIRALKALLKDRPFDRRAMYGLGTYCLRLRDSGKTKEAKALGEFLVGRLALAKVSTEIVTALRSIANSGYAAALPKVTPYLDDKTESVRVAAVRALQAMRDPKVDGLLATRIKTDKSNDVRVSAIVAAQVREPSTELSQGLASAGETAPDATVRFRAVELMVRWLPKRPELRSTLERVAQKDQEARVRDRAKAAL
jgi:hypothetical protein